jgi:hypothetical protein
VATIVERLQITAVERAHSHRGMDPATARFCLQTCCTSQPGRPLTSGVAMEQVMGPREKISASMAASPGSSSLPKEERK